MDDKLSESALDKHNAENDVYRTLYGGNRVIPSRLLSEGAAALCQRPGHDKAAEQAWRENTARQPRVCVGLSCNQHRKPCRENCPTLAEMECAGGDDPLPWWTPVGVVVAAVVLAGLAMLAGYWLWQFVPPDWLAFVFGY